MMRTFFADMVALIDRYLVQVRIFASGTESTGSVVLRSARWEIQGLLKWRRKWRRDCGILSSLGLSEQDGGDDQDRDA